MGRSHICFGFRLPFQTALCVAVVASKGKPEAVGITHLDISNYRWVCLLMVDWGGEWHRRKGLQ